MSDDRTPVANIAPFGLRMQPELKSRIEAVAKNNNRSMNAEIVQRLEDSFSIWPRIELPEYMQRRMDCGDENQRQMYSDHLNKVALDIAKDYFSVDDFQIVEIMRGFARLTRDVSPSNREDIKSKLGVLFSDILKALPSDEADRAFENLYEAFNLDYVPSKNR